MEDGRAYKYKAGDQPLTGYTIKHAAGRGGFGEVYFAESDSGKEVAIKAIQANEKIELRGLQQCMNLRSPHLVSIFDVRHNERGESFAIMEFITGPSLQDLLNDAAKSGQQGLGEDKARFFITEIAKGMSVLHDSGIVHRDLKPSNIFFDQGYVKIGDYGLSKLMSESQHSAQTVTVGTVQYMAPEIGQGQYNRSVDIYALGVLLYEMLTGKVPYAGKTPMEIMMRHLSDTPDFTAFEEPFKTALEKSLAKDPADRFQSVQEMAESLGAAPDVMNNVSAYAETVRIKKQREFAIQDSAIKVTMPPVEVKPTIDGAKRQEQRGGFAGNGGASRTGGGAGGSDPYRPPADDGVNPEAQTLASRSERFGGFMIDLVAEGIIMFPLVFFILVESRGDIPLIGSIFIGLIGFIVHAAIQGYLLGKHGQTVGKKLVGTRIVSYTTGEKLSLDHLLFMRSFIITMIASLGDAGVFFSFVSILFIFGESRRCLHDHIAGTKVIKC